MPEGPSLVILIEEVKSFTGKKVIAVSGNSKQDIQRLEGKKIIEFKTWGKHFLICFKDFSIRIHFLLFGKSAVNERLENRIPRLSLEFKTGELNLYACSIQFIEDPLDDVYDWGADVMSDEWDEMAARKKIKQKSTELVTDVLLDQNIFAGVGNIIKNEVLYRTKVHPESIVGKISAKKITELIKEARNYSFDFLEWKKQYVLKKNWLAHTKKTCVRDQSPIIKNYLGKTNRRCFFCESCQKKYV